MKNKAFTYLLITLLLICASLIVSCDIGINTDEGTPSSIPQYNEDVQIVPPESIETENFVVDKDKTYYTSAGISLWMEVNGEYLKMDYFTLDGNKRIYDNLYFYKDDYFYMVTGDAKYLYASLSGSESSEYAEVEKQDGEDVQINIKKQGIYKLIFDADTLKFDIEYKADIETPVYYPMKSCSVYSVTAEKWTEMSVNPLNEDEFCIKDFALEKDKSISFFSNIHTSNYKVTLEESCNNKHASARKTEVKINIGGTYNIYVNKKTYVVRLELQNPDTASYSCMYYDGNDIAPVDLYEQGTPYIFHKRIEVTDTYEAMPKFYTSAYREYALDVAEASVVSKTGKSYYFRKTGTYDLIINLKTFEITIEQLPE